MGTFNDKMTGLADAFRSKFSITGGLTIDQMTTTVSNAAIGGGGGFDFSAATDFTADQLLEGEKGFNSNGELITGTLTISDTPVTPQSASEYGYFTADGNFQQITLDADAPQNVGESVEITEGSVFLYATGQDEPDYSITTDATAADVAYGKTVVLNGMLVTGAMPTATVSITDNIVSVTAGKTDAQTLTVAEAAVPTVSDNVVTVNKGYQSTEKQIAVGTVLAAKTYTPGSSPIVIKAGQFLTGDQTIEAVENNSFDFSAATSDFSAVLAVGQRAYNEYGVLEEGAMEILPDKLATFNAMSELDGANKNIKWLDSSPGYASGMSYVEINGLSEVKPENIKKDVVIAGVTGTYGGESSGGGVAMYKCTAVDTGMAYPDYTNIRISGVTPSAMNTEYTQNDPMLVDFNRTWTANGNSVGWDKTNSAWCIYEGDGTPNYVSSLFYSKIEGMSAEKGSATDPFFWDAENTASDNRMLTVAFDSSNAPYDEMAYSGSWNVYARLKAGVEYTVGIIVPPDTDDTWYDGIYFYLYDDKNNNVASCYSRQSAINIGGKDCTWYAKYTPTADGIFRLNFYSEYNQVITPFACSPAPEVTTAPKMDVFEQGDNWQIGGGQNAGVRVLSAGLPQCVGDFTQIAGDGVDTDSVWQNADGSVYIYAFCTNTSYNTWVWCMGDTAGASYGKAYYYTPYVDVSPTQPLQHPGLVEWNNRNSSSYGDYPVTSIAPTSTVSGAPLLTPVEKLGRDALGYSVWSGVKMEQVGGVWQETGEIKEDMQSAAFTPTPGSIYSKDGSVQVQNAYRGETSVLCWGANHSTYGVLGIGDTKEKYTPVKSERVYTQIACYTYHALALDADGHLWGWGRNDYGQIGDGTTTNNQTAVKVGDKVWKQVAVGDTHSVGLDTDGYLYVWGYNARGELGNGSAEGTRLSAPTQISDKKFTYIHAYYRCTFALDEDGYMWGSGINTSGELGNGTKTNIYTLAKLNDKKWKSVWSAHSNRTYAIDTDGYLWGSGSNNNGQLGIGQSSGTVYEFTRCGDLRWKKVVGGHKHTIAINEEGFLYACGQGYGTDGLGNHALTRIPNIGKVKDCLGTYEGSFYIDEYDRLFTFTASSTDYMFGLPLYGAQTTKPVHILQDYRVERLYCTIDAKARFAIVKE